MWPKAIDLSLCMLWLSFMICLLTIENDRDIRLYMGVFINGTLALISLISTLIGKPWIAQNAADTVSDNEYIQKLENPTVASERKRLGFLYICSVLTMYWFVLFSIIAGLVLINVELNTKITNDKVLSHPNTTVFILMGIVAPFSVVFLGIWSSPRISKILEAHLRSSQATNVTESFPEGIEEGDTISEDTKRLSSISKPLLN